jgi:L-lysine 2,3-aminomutase
MGRTGPERGGTISTARAPQLPGPDAPRRRDRSFAATGAAADVQAALGALRASRSTLLNQSVLLRGVNDSIAALEELSVALFESGVLPYYLHLLDPVRGAAHFDVPADSARRLLAQLTARLPGYLVPKLVREDPGAASKTMLPPASR